MLIKVRAFPGEKEEEVIKKSEDSFDIKIREKPKKGEANKGIIRVLSSHFRIPGTQIKIIKGFRERNKIFEIKC